MSHDVGTIPSADHVGPNTGTALSAPDACCRTIASTRTAGASAGRARAGPTAAYHNVLVAMCLVLATAQFARADPLFWLEHLGEGAASLGDRFAPAGAERSAERAAKGAAKGAVEETAQGAAKLPGSKQKRAVLETADRGAFRLVNQDDNSLIAEFRPETEAAAAILASPAYQIVIPEHLFAKRPDVAAWILRQTNLHAAVLAGDGLWPLRLERFAEHQEILVEASPTLGLTMQAFAKRAALERLSAGPLVRRMRVVPLISRADPVAVAAFRDVLMQAATPPAGRAEALRLVSQSREKLLVITGHVEADAFVVRSPTGAEEFRVPIDEIYRAAEAAHSEALLLGCRVACATSHTGPLRDVTADAVIHALASVDPAANAMSFLQQLSGHAGPLLIQDDHRGGFLIIDDADARWRNAKWAAGTEPVRLAIQPTGQNVSAVFAEDGEWDARPVLTILAKVLLAGPFIAVLGWPVLMLCFGMGPEGGWREIKKQRSLTLKLEDELAPIPDRAILLYLAFGPWVPINNAIVKLATLAMNSILLIHCPLGAVAIVIVALIAVFRTRLRLNRMPRKDRASVFTLYLVLATPLLFGAWGAATVTEALFTPDVPTYLPRTDIAFASSDMIPDGIAIAAACSLYALALWLRYAALLGVCSAIFGFLIGWPCLSLAWVEARLLRQGRQDVA